MYRLMARLSKILLLASLLLALTFALSPHTLPAAAQEARFPKIAFVSADEETRKTTIMIADPDGTHVQPFLTHWKLLHPAWSPDGRHLAFSGSDGSNETRMNVYVIDSDGTNLRLVSGRHYSSSPGTPVWSSDSQQIMYPVYLDYSAEVDLYRVNLDGTNEQKIVFPGDLSSSLRMQDSWIAWSPDGTQIAFRMVNYEHFDINGQLMVANADTSNPQPFPVTAPDGVSFSYLSWAPDGQHVLLYFLNGMTSEHDILGVANPDGSNLHQIQGSARNIWNASWSPDGSQIVFVANEAGVDWKPDFDLWVVNADGSNLHPLNIDVFVWFFGTSWGLLPSDVVLPTEPIILRDALK